MFYILRIKKAKWFMKSKTKELAQKYLEKSWQDISAVKEMADNDLVSDEIVGFHAQQSVEKMLKALLCLNEVEFRKTHDLRELLDLCADNQIILHDDFERTDELTSFAVQYRYDFFMSGDSYDREDSKELIVRLYEWTKCNC